MEILNLLPIAELPMMLVGCNQVNTMILSQLHGDHAIQAYSI